jgi:hypothetical protein
MNPDSKSHRKAILVALGVQILAWAALALLDTLVGGHQIRISVAVQVVWPVLLTWYWSQDLTLRRLAVIVNVLYAFMVGTGVIAAVMACFYETSWHPLGRLALLITIASTYLLNAFLLRPSEKRDPNGAKQ